MICGCNRHNLAAVVGERRRALAPPGGPTPTAAGIYIFNGVRLNTFILEGCMTNRFSAVMLAFMFLFIITGC